MVLSSLSSVLFHVRSGLPRLLLPCGFQSRDLRTMLFGSLRRVCPIHRHFLFLMVMPVDDNMFGTVYVCEQI